MTTAPGKRRVETSRPARPWCRVSGISSVPATRYEDLEVSKRVAWILRGIGGGLLLKGSGDNTVPWLGFTFSASRICFPDGHIFKILTDAGPGGTNGPQYADNDFVDPSSYFKAVDPRIR